METQLALTSGALKVAVDEVDVVGMSSVAQPRYSDDGQFYWDGYRWVPVASQAPSAARVEAPSHGSTGTCPNCGAVGTLERIRGLQGAETLIAAALMLLFLIPGIVYYIAMESRPICSACRRRA